MAESIPAAPSRADSPLAEEDTDPATLSSPQSPSFAPLSPGPSAAFSDEEYGEEGNNYFRDRLSAMPTFDVPAQIRASRFSKKMKLWKHTSNSMGPHIEKLPSTLRILTWNVDFMTPNARTRLRCILDHIQCDVFECKNGERPPPCCILLQEVHRDAFRTILSHQWVKDHFVVAPSSRHHWPLGATYGLATLVSRTVPTTAVHAITFSNSRMHRVALFADVKLGVPLPFKERMITVRVGNAHLESLPVGETARQGQMGLITDFLKEEGLHAAVVCGDMNAISYADELLPNKLGLVDAWQSGDVDVGMTWGFQPPQARFPVGRLDKILHVAGTGFMVEEPQRVGVGLKTTQNQWASDHVGLLTAVHIISG